MTKRIAVLVSLSALLLSLLPVVPAGAQDASGWIYVARGGEIIAMRPDGSGQLNVTQTPDRVEDEPDVSNASGLTMYVHFTTSTDQQGIADINLGSGSSDDRIPATSTQLGDPSHGSDDTYLYIHDRFQQIARYDVFTGQRVEVAGDSFPSVFQPSGSPTESEAFAYVAAGGDSAVRVANLDPANGQDGAVGAENYDQARYPSYGPDGSYVVFSCKSGEASWNICRSGTVPTVNDFSIIPTPAGEAWSPVVSPQGDRVAWRDGAGNVWVAGIDGANPVQIANGDGGEDPALGIDWGPDIQLAGAPAEDPPPPPPPMEDPAPNTPLGPRGTDGDPATTDRAEFSSPGPFSTAVSESRFRPASSGSGGGGVTIGGGGVFTDTSAFGGAGLPQAQYALLGRDDAFADSLAGAPLTKNGPLLFTPTDRLADGAADELRRVLLPGATVYLLGGTAALQDAVEQAVSDLGFAPRRLAGPSRFETAVVVAREVVALGGSTDEVLVARGVGPEDNPTAAWADSVTGGAYAAAAFVPVVVTQTETVHPAVQGYIDDVGATATLLGGTAALNADVESALPGSRRIAGLSRADTAAMIATELIGLSTDEFRDVLLFDAFAENAWTFGLAGAGLAADRGAALLASGPDFLPPETEALLSTCGDPQVETLILGWEGLIPASVATSVDQLDGEACS